MAEVRRVRFRYSEQMMAKLNAVYSEEVFSVDEFEELTEEIGDELVLNFDDVEFTLAPVPGKKHVYLAEER